MTYDRDLRQLRIVLWILAALNFTGVVANVWIHQWLAGLCCLLWTGSTLLYISSIRSQQRTRDEVRIAGSAIRAMREEIEEP
jgi:hypothetical protein